MSLNTGRDDRSGFTLIEITIVAVIISIIALIGITNFQSWIRHFNATGYIRDVNSTLQEARTRANAASVRQRVVIDIGGQSVTLQERSGALWPDVRPSAPVPPGVTIGSVVPTPGSAVTSSSYALVFNPAGDVYGQSAIADDNTIAALTSAVIFFTAINPADNGSITVFGWTGKTRIN